MPVGSVGCNEIARLWEEFEMPLQPDTNEETRNEQHNSKSNVQGLLLYHPILLNSPWDAPVDLNDQISKLLLTSEPILMGRAEKQDKEGEGDNRDKDNA